MPIDLEKLRELCEKYDKIKPTTQADSELCEDMRYEAMAALPELLRRLKRIEGLTGFDSNWLTLPRQEIYDLASGKGE